MEGSTQELLEIDLLEIVLLLSVTLSKDTLVSSNLLVVLGCILLLLINELMQVSIIL